MKEVVTFIAGELLQTEILNLVDAKMFEEKCLGNVVLYPDLNRIEITEEYFLNPVSVKNLSYRLYEVFWMIHHSDRIVCYQGSDPSVYLQYAIAFAKYCMKPIKYLDEDLHEKPLALTMAIEMWFIFMAENISKTPLDINNIIVDLSGKKYQFNYSVFAMIDKLPIMNLDDVRNILTTVIGINGDFEIETSVLMTLCDDHGEVVRNLHIKRKENPAD